MDISKALGPIFEALDTQELFISQFEEQVGNVVNIIDKAISAASSDVKPILIAVRNAVEETANPESDVKDTLLNLSDILRECALDASTS